jgi:protein gp37
MTKTTIEWADEVWNPTTGCTKVSQGCKNCYAERIANRFWGERKFTDVQCHSERVLQPLHWRKPRRIFVDSMSDLFHPSVPAEFIHDVFSSMIGYGNTRHTFMILTKRPERMFEVLTSEMFTFWHRQDANDHVKNHVWLGVSVENQQTADERIPLLLQTPAAVRFVSVEPMLGPVDLDPTCRGFFGTLPNQPGIDWVICGCESGTGARPMELDWARSLKDQCVEAGVAFFLKQAVIGGKLVKMPELDGRVWDQYPESKP